jgi:hypothetical protein
MKKMLTLAACLTALGGMAPRAASADWGHPAANPWGPPGLLGRDFGSSGHRGNPWDRPAIPGIGFGPLSAGVNPGGRPGLPDRTFGPAGVPGADPLGLPFRPGTNVPLVRGPANPGGVGGVPPPRPGDIEQLRQQLDVKPVQLPPNLRVPPFEPRIPSTYQLDPPRPRTEVSWPSWEWVVGLLLASLVVGILAGYAQEKPSADG